MKDLNNDLIRTEPAAKPRRAANRRSLTQLFCDRVKPPRADAITYWDTNAPGFGIRISARGRRTWICMYRVQRKDVMQSIATTAMLPRLQDAREAARKLMLLAREGIDPRKAKAAAADREQAEKAFSYSDLVTEFLARHHRDSRESTRYEAARLLRRAGAILGDDKAANAIERSDIRRVLDELAASRQRPWRGDNGPARSEANGVLRHLRTMFRWGLNEEVVAADPTTGLRLPFKPGEARDRTQTDAELVQLWHACEKEVWPFGRICQILILTGARCREVGNLRWGEIDLENALWTLPAERSKNRKKHLVPLSEPVLAILRELPRVHDEFLFPGRERRSGLIAPVQAYSDFKARIDAVLPIAAWTLHDLRRTVATNLQRLGVRLEVTESVLNHRSGSRAGIVGVYQKYDFFVEAGAALELWAKHLRALISGEPAASNVIQMAR